LHYGTHDEQIEKTSRAPKRRVSEMTPVKAPWVDGYTDKEGRWERRDDIDLNLKNVANGQNRPFRELSARVK